MDFFFNRFNPALPPLLSRIITPTYAIQPLGYVDLSSFRASKAAEEGPTAPSHGTHIFEDRLNYLSGTIEDRSRISRYDDSSDLRTARDIHQPTILDIFAHPPHPICTSSLPPSIPGPGLGRPPQRPEIGRLPCYTAFDSPGRNDPIPNNLEIVLTDNYERSQPVANALKRGR